MSRGERVKLITALGEGGAFVVPVGWCKDKMTFPVAPAEESEGWHAPAQPIQRAKLGGVGDVTGVWLEAAKSSRF